MPATVCEEDAHSSLQTVFCRCAWTSKTQTIVAIATRFTAITFLMFSIVVRFCFLKKSLCRNTGTIAHDWIAFVFEREVPTASAIDNQQLSFTIYILTVRKCTNSVRFWYSEWVKQKDKLYLPFGINGQKQTSCFNASTKSRIILRGTLRIGKHSSVVWWQQKNKQVVDELPASRTRIAFGDCL